MEFVSCSVPIVRLNNGNLRCQGVITNHSVDDLNALVNFGLSYSDFLELSAATWVIVVSAWGLKKVGQRIWPKI